MMPVTIQVDDEVKALGDALQTLLTDIKEKKAVSAIIGDTIPMLMQAIAGYASLGGDLKKVDNQVYVLKCLGGALEPAA